MTQLKSPVIFTLTFTFSLLCIYVNADYSIITHPIMNPDSHLIYNGNRIYYVVHICNNLFDAITFDSNNSLNLYLSGGIGNNISRLTKYNKTSVALICLSYSECDSYYFYILCKSNTCVCDNDVRYFSEIPTLIPTQIPTPIPTQIPTLQPTRIPTRVPTLLPTSRPISTRQPRAFTMRPVSNRKI